MRIYKSDELDNIIDEINRLINYNQNKVIKTNIVLFIIEITWKLFNLTNYNITMMNVK